MFMFLKKNGVPTIQTYGLFNEFSQDYNQQKIDFPVFVKPRNGSGSVGARKVSNLETLKRLTDEDSSLIIQEYMVQNMVKLN